MQIANSDRLKALTKHDVTTIIEAQLWIEKLWEHSYEDLDVWEKENITHQILSYLQENIIESVL